MDKKTADTCEMVVKQGTSKDIKLSAVADFSPYNLPKVSNSIDSAALHSSTGYTQPHFEPASLTDENIFCDNLLQIKHDIFDDLTELKLMHTKLIDDLSIATGQSTDDKNAKVVTENSLWKFEKHQPVDESNVNMNRNNLQNNYNSNTEPETIKPREIWKMHRLKVMFNKNVPGHKKVKLERKSNGRNVCKVKLYLCARPAEYMKTYSSEKDHIIISEKSHECDICHKKYTLKDSLALHTKISCDEKKDLCDECSKKYIITHQFPLLKKGDFEGKNECNVCHRKFPSLEELNGHKIIHTGQKKNECDVCHKMFTTSSYLTEHKRIHCEETMYSCDECPKMYLTQKLLIRHKKVHFEKKYECDVCQKKFLFQYMLNSHKIIHTGEKRNECDVCHRRFNKSSNLEQHKKIHTPSRVKEYECEICNKRFFTNGKLTLHKKIHSGEKTFLCDECSKMFFTLSQLKTHQIVHSKKHECKVCKKKFACRSKLNIHENIHTGEKPHVCDVCGRKFLRSDYLRKHKNLHARL